MNTLRTWEEEMETFTWPFGLQPHPCTKRVAMKNQFCCRFFIRVGMGKRDAWRERFFYLIEYT